MSEHIWKQGFPDSTPRDQAIQQAETAALALYPGTVLTRGIEQSAEHALAGEYLVKLRIVNIPETGDGPSPIPSDPAPKELDLIAIGRLMEDAAVAYAKYKEERDKPKDGPKK